MQQFAEIMYRLDKGFRQNPAFRNQLEELLAIKPFDFISAPFEPSGSDGLILTAIIQMAENVPI